MREHPRVRSVVPFERGGRDGTWFVAVAARGSDSHHSAAVAVLPMTAADPGARAWQNVTQVEEEADKLDKTKEEELKKLVDESYNDPEKLAREIADAFGLENG